MIDHRKVSDKIGRNLKKLRLEKGLMQIDVAVATDLNRSLISRIETGKARITYALACQLMLSLNITFSDLVVGIDDKDLDCNSGGDNNEMD